MSDRIEKWIELPAPVARVWRALTDHREFGEWFGVRLDGPFVAGQAARGHILYPGYENVPLEFVVQEMVPERAFAFTWHPYAIDPAVDYSHEKPTRVDFRLHEDIAGTQLSVVESGFKEIPLARRAEARRMNDAGWNMQLENLAAYLARDPVKTHAEAQEA